MRLPSFLYAILATSAPCLGLATSQIYEAEEGSPLGQTRLALTSSDNTARIFVTCFKHPGDGVEITVRTPETGYYFLELGYACDADKRVPIAVNGNAQGSRFFPKTAGFSEQRYGRIFLTSGEHVIEIGTDWGYIDLDYIRFVPADAPEPFQLATAPVNPRASAEARQLFTKLTADFGHRTWSGQHEANPAAPTRLAHIAQLTQGAAPALLGLDLLFYSGAWNRPEGDGAIEKARDWALHENGIVTLSWHWFAPGGFSARVWDSFWTDKTTFNLGQLTDETSVEYRAIIEDLDRIASKLKILRDAGVPVLWRPLHEAEGRWFWWGAGGTAASKHLYLLMFDRFTRIHRLDNLLWVWTSTDDPDAINWYPGDDYVDIIATDLYSPAGTRGDFFTVFDTLRERYQGRKPIALGECGVIPELSTHAPWLWFLTWDDFITREDMNPPDHVARIFADPRVVNRPPSAAPSTR
ncbi:MAG: glycosyl hydrolase [Rariglobus sp.]